MLAGRKPARIGVVHLLWPVFFTTSYSLERGFDPV
jgi:hypothetical protein